MKEKIYDFESLPILSIFRPINILITKKTSLQFKSVPILLIFCPKNILMFEKIGHFFESVIDFARVPQGWGCGTMPPPLNN